MRSAIESYSLIKKISLWNVSRISPTAWSTKTAGGNEDEINFSIKANFNKNLPRPGLKAVTYDGVRHECKPGALRPSVVTTKVCDIWSFHHKIKHNSLTVY